MKSKSRKSDLIIEDLPEDMKLLLLLGREHGARPTVVWGLGIKRTVVSEA